MVKWLPEREIVFLHEVNLCQILLCTSLEEPTILNTVITFLVPAVYIYNVLHISSNWQM